MLFIPLFFSSLSNIIASISSLIFYEQQFLFFDIFAFMVLEQLEPHAQKEQSFQRS